MGVSLGQNLSEMEALKRMQSFLQRETHARRKEDGIDLQKLSVACVPEYEDYEMVCKHINMQPQLLHLKLG